MAHHFFTDQVRTELYGLILMQGFRKDGVPWYCYLSVRMDMLKELAEKQAEGIGVEPTDYGRVLAHGIGVPDLSVRARMEEEYGFNHEEWLNITQPIHAPDQSHE
ncbi:hypothetical protein GC177_00305 [bacterium]|nr:hypothetical protein [bacterium]